MTGRLRFYPRVAPKTDASGLHAKDCACVRCEDGFRPTDADRFAAAEALRLAAITEAEAKKRAAAKLALDASAHQTNLRLAALRKVTPSAPPPGGFRQWQAEQEKQTQKGTK